MPEYDTVVVDLDGCLAYDGEPSLLDKAITKASVTIGGDSLGSGPKILRELIGATPDYQTRDDVEPYFEDADKTIILTGRPNWPRIRDTTEKILEDYPHDIDTTIMYPGTTLEGEDVIEDQQGTVDIFTGNGIPAYKQAVLDEVIDETNDVAYIDDSADCHEAVSDFDIDQYQINGTITRYTPDN